MPKTYESGRESSLLADIKAGSKTIEARLKRSKFAMYQPGDLVWLREDVYKDGKEIQSIPHQVLVMLKKIETYPDFKTMLTKVGYKNVIPRAASLHTAVNECYKFYKSSDEKQYGVLAIYFEVIKISSE